jgi:hypothetical protein
VSGNNEPEASTSAVVAVKRKMDRKRKSKVAVMKNCIECKILWPLEDMQSHHGSVHPTIAYFPALYISNAPCKKIHPAPPKVQPTKGAVVLEVRLKAQVQVVNKQKI